MNRSRAPFAGPLLVTLALAALAPPHEVRAQTPTAKASLAAAITKGIKVSGSVTPSIYQLYGVNDRRQWLVHLELSNATRYDIALGKDLILVASDATGATFNGVYHARGRTRPPGQVGMTSDNPWAAGYSLSNFDLQWADGSMQGYCDGGTYTFRDASEESREKDPDKLTFGRLAAGASRTLEVELLQGRWLKHEHAASLRVALPELIVTDGTTTSRCRLVAYFSKPAAADQPWPFQRLEVIPLETEPLTRILARAEENVVTRIFAANWLMEVDPGHGAGAVARTALSVADGDLLFACFNLLAASGGPANSDLVAHAQTLIADADTPNGIRAAATTFLTSAGARVPAAPATVSAAAQPASVPAVPEIPAVPALPAVPQIPEIPTVPAVAAMPAPASTVASAAVAAVDVGAQPAELRRQLQAMYVDYLRGNGYQPTVDKDGDVQFMHEGLTFYILIDDKDAQFFRLLLPRVWVIENDADRARAVAASERVGRLTKVAKAYITQTQADIAVELFVVPPEDFKDSFARAISVLQTGRTKFFEAMKQ